LKKEDFIKTKFIFITGGTVSGIGKGITVASLGRLLKNKGYKVLPIKIDPYLNTDAGTMNPFEHGEVFVTDDGAETDLDLGHYERFIDINLSQASNFTTGSIYQIVINQERDGNFLGKTIQIIPHIANEIKRKILTAAKKFDPDIELIEIGGTIGDIEGQPYIEAVRQFRREISPENCLFIHVVKMDYLYPSGDQKTKPIQQSVTLLRGFGIQPDFLIVRCKEKITSSAKEKISLFCDVPEKRIIEALDSDSLYEIPNNLEKDQFSEEVLNCFCLKPKKSRERKIWQNLMAELTKIKNGKRILKIAMVGKYLDNPDAYLSVEEALNHAGMANGINIQIVPVDPEKNNLEKKLKKVDSIIVPGGFGVRGIEGKIRAAKYSRENKIPYLGLCLGLQIAIIEFARHVCKMAGANSTEFNPKTKYPVIDFLPGQKKIRKKGGTMRLGAYPAILKAGTQIRKLYGKTRISERHRHRYEVNPKYHKILQKNGLLFSGLSPDKTLVEFIEFPQNIHPYFVATQAHPEFKSRPNRPHPLFSGLIKAVLKKKNYNE
jgi:CTP synthase